MRGIATSGALALAVEETLLDLGDDDLRPVRWTLDLFRVARMLPSLVDVDVEIVRRGRRVCLLDATLSQDGRPVARAGALCLAAGSTADGVVWSPAVIPEPPAAQGVQAGGAERLYRSGSGPWVPPRDAPYDADRKALWQFPIPVIDDVAPTPFQMAACAADLASATTNLGTNGLEYVNADATLTMGRLPNGLEVGLQATDRVERDGIAVGTARMFDRTGVFGTVTVTALENAAHTVNLRQHGHGV